MAPGMAIGGEDGRGILLAVPPVFAFGDEIAGGMAPGGGGDNGKAGFWAPICGPMGAGDDGPPTWIILCAPFCGETGTMVLLLPAPACG